MKIWNCSDTHGFHKQLMIPKDIDVLAVTDAEFNKGITFHGNIITV